MNGTEHVGHLGAKGRTLLKRVLKMWVLIVRARANRVRTVAKGGLLRTQQHRLNFRLLQD